MNKPSQYKVFAFDAYLDAAMLSDLYSDDYVMIEEIFGEVLPEYDELVEKINAHWASGDIPGLKSAVHKIKPLFGYTGLTAIQTQCQHFGDSCLAHPAIDSLSGEFEMLKISLIKGRAIIESEKNRLSLFNS